MKYAKATVLVGACLLGVAAHAQGKLPTERVSFEKAIEQAQDLKSCKKKDRLPIHRAYLADAAGNELRFPDPPPQFKPGQVVFLVTFEKFAGNGGMGGPLDRIPSRAELKAIKGKPTCVPLD